MVITFRIASQTGYFHEFIFNTHLWTSLLWVVDQLSGEKAYTPVKTGHFWVLFERLLYLSATDTHEHSPAAHLHPNLQSDLSVHYDICWNNVWEIAVREKPAVEVSDSFPSKGTNCQLEFPTQTKNTLYAFQGWCQSHPGFFYFPCSFPISFSFLEVKLHH